MTHITRPRLGVILSQAASSRKHEHNRLAAQAKERDKLLTRHPVCRRRRESETWLLPQLIYHWALRVVEQRPVEWEAGQRYWSGLTGYSVTTTSQNYAALSQAGLIEVEGRGPKGWNGWQTNVLRPGKALMPAIFEKARQIRAATRAAKALAKKIKLSLTPGQGKESGVSDNLEDKGPSGGFFTELAKTAHDRLIRLPLRAPPAKSTA